MAEKKEKVFYPCIMQQKNCAACHNGICGLLENVDFKGNKCPFYKTEDQRVAEDTKALQRLMRIGRFDLIRKYRGKKVRNTDGC